MGSYFSKVNPTEGEDKLPRRRKFYEEVSEVFKDRGYRLITKEYRNNKQRLKYICPKHPNEPQTTRLNDLLSGHGCRLCGMDRTIQNMRKQAESRKLSYNAVKSEIEKEGFTLLSDEYINAKHRLEIRCPEGHEFKTRIADFREGVRKCRDCAINDSRTPFEEVKKSFEEMGYVLLETDYINRYTPMKYICPKHPDEVKEISLGSIRGGHGCYECGLERISGKNSVHYNHDLSDEERSLDRRYDPKEREWRIKVFERDKYTCQRCGNSGRSDLNAHHKDAHHWCVDRRYDETNGVTLCESCHKDFHQEYGYRNNTEEQFDEWINGRQAIT